MTQTSGIIDLRTIGDNSFAQCHLMPCRIEHQELSVKATEYFHPTIRLLGAGDDDNDQGRNKETYDSKEANGNDDPILAASFRGRPLHGRKVTLPDGFRGHVVGKDPRSILIPTKKFREFTYWNWDALPRKEDEIIKSLQWIEISKAIHDD